MATYSTFFSSGLLAPEADRPSTPGPSTPRPPTRALDDTTPTASAHTATPSTSASSDALPTLAEHTTSAAISAPIPSGERPILRRRRSSLSIAVSPVAAIKIPQGPRSAIHRQSIGRSRSGSIQSIHDLSVVGNTVTGNDTDKPNGFIGRLRSGSVGTALKPRRARKHTTLPSPAPPPPTSPLPDLPILSPITIPITNKDALPSTPRRSIIQRRRTAETLPIPLMTPSATLSSGMERMSIVNSLGTPSFRGVTDYFASEVRL